MGIQIRTPELKDRAEWGQLWRQYLDFYQAIDIKEDHTHLLWQRIHTQNHPIQCRLAQDMDSKTLVGFVNFLPRVDTWRRDPVGYLEDLFVCPNHRGQGTAQRLIEHVVAHARGLGWEQVYWQTQADNLPARRLYDKLTGGTNGFINYAIKL